MRGRRQPVTAARLAEILLILMLCCTMQDGLITHHHPSQQNASLNTPGGPFWPASRRTALDRLLRKQAQARRLSPCGFESDERWA
jgi:hypothetical protein